MSGWLLYFAIVGLQLSSTFASGTVPLSCFLQNPNFYNIFNSATDRTNYGATENSLQFDPLRINAVNMNKDGWILNTTNLEYRGLNNAVLDDFGFNFNANLTYITFHTDMVITCQYITEGTVFSLPISGEGSCLVNIYNVQFGMIMPFNIYEESHRQFISLRNFNYFYDIQDGAVFNFYNLYNGDKKSSDRMHHLWNANWKFITQHYSPIFMEAAADSMFQYLRDAMQKRPLKY